MGAGRPLPKLELIIRAESPPPSGPASATICGGFGWGAPLVQWVGDSKSSNCARTTARAARQAESQIHKTLALMDAA